MNHLSSTTNTPHRQACPSWPISVDLPLATIEELDNLAELNHITRQQLLTQLITVALINDTPYLPTGQDPAGRLAQHAYLTRQRSLELAIGRPQP